MNAQDISIRHTALGWVKKAIDENLSEIQTDLNRYVENNEQDLLDGVKQRLAVVQGVLVMIEQYGAAMLTEEMIALVDFIVVEKNSQDDQALEVLLRAVLQLPDYLEHIQADHHDTPIAILPLLNDVRAVRNQDLFSEKLLFLPDLSMHEDYAEIESVDDASNQSSRLLAKKLRPVFQLALVNIIHYRAVEENLKRLEKICEALEARSVSEQVRRIWGIVGALIESVGHQQLELGVSIKSLLGKVDALFREIVIFGERGLLRRQPVELIKNLLFYIAPSECDGPKALAIKTAYGLEQFLPSEVSQREVLDNIADPYQALLKTVAESTMAEIKTIKSTLEIYVNGDLSQVDTLKDLPHEMHIISDTLAMIGLGSQRQLIEVQIISIKNILAAGKVVNQEQLRSMPTELLQVERALEQMSKRQPDQAEKAYTESDVSRGYELDSQLSSVVTAALEDIQKTKTAILEFIKAPERTENIDLCITLMLESRDAMQLLEQQRAVDVVDGLLMYFRGCRVSKFMEDEQLDSLSQIVVSLEYYLETMVEHRNYTSSMLELADLQLQKLLTDLSSDGETGANDRTIVPRKDDVDENLEVTEAASAQELDEPNLEDSWISEPAQGKRREPNDSVNASTESVDRVSADDCNAVGKVASSQSAAVGIVPVDDGVEVLKSRSNAEILEIYLEEAEEEASNIVRLQKDWMLHPGDENALKNIHRSFHTIKGSGRVVGALKISEFAWDYEQLLNRIIDKTVLAERPVINAVGNAGKALTELVHELKTSEEPSSDIPYLRGLARALAEFRTEELLLDQIQTEAFGESPHDHIAGAEENKSASKGESKTGNKGSNTTTQAISSGQVESRDGIEANALGGDPAAPLATRDEVKSEPAGLTTLVSTIIPYLPKHRRFSRWLTAVGPRQKSEK